MSVKNETFSNKKSSSGAIRSKILEILKSDGSESEQDNSEIRSISGPIVPKVSKKKSKKNENSENFANLNS